MIKIETIFFAAVHLPTNKLWDLQSGNWADPSPACFTTDRGIANWGWWKNDKDVAIGQFKTAQVGTLKGE